MKMHKGQKRTNSVSCPAPNAMAETSAFATGNEVERRDICRAVCKLKTRLDILSQGLCPKQQRCIVEGNFLAGRITYISTRTKFYVQISLCFCNWFVLHVQALWHVINIEANSKIDLGLGLYGPQLPLHQGHYHISQGLSFLYLPPLR